MSIFTDPSVVAAFEALRAALVTVLVLLLGALTLIVGRFGPTLIKLGSAYLQARIDAYYAEKLAGVLEKKADAILDPGNPTTPVDAVQQIMTSYGDTVAKVGTTVAELGTALNDVVSRKKALR